MQAGLKLLWRDWRGGELNILIISLLLATATVTSISLFTNRIQNSIEQEASEFLAGDAQIRGSMPIPQDWLDQADTMEVRTAKAVGFRAMAFSDNGMNLTVVKAVSSEYPLKGVLEVSNTPFTPGDTKAGGPPSGEVWLASRLFGALDVEVGDRISIGEAELTVSGALIKEPDSAQSFFGVAPRAMININDVPATGAIQTGSRVNHTVMLAGEKSDIEQFNQWVTSRLGNHHRWRGIEEGNRGIGDALQRARSFLLLSGSLGVILSGVAVALAARRYAHRQTSHVALLKTFGYVPNQVTRLYAINIVAMGIIGVIVGTFLGWALHWGLLQTLGQLLPAGLAPASWSAYFTGGVSGFAALLAFAAPPLMALRRVPPAKVLRDDIDSNLVSSAASGLIGFVAVALLVFWYSRDIALTVILTVGASLALTGVGLVAWFVIRASKTLANRVGKTWRLGLANLQRHQRFNTLQIMIFSVLLMLLFVLSVTRTGLITEWQTQLPEDAPNHFVYNVFPQEREQLETFFAEAGVESRPFYPMVRGRIININDDLLKDRAEASESDMNYERELNLTWADQPGDDNTIIEGQWWEQDAQNVQVSVEKEYARGVDIGLGDVLTFSVAGQSIEAEVTSLRTVDWDSMNPNFFIIFNQPILDGIAANWLTSFYLPEDKKPLLNTLSRAHPTISLIELDQVINQMQSIISKVTLAVEFILFLITGSGVLVLITSIQATLDIRLRESAILRTLGANRKLVNHTLLIEFGSLGWLAGLLGAAGAETTLFFLQTQVFNLDYIIHWRMWLIAPWLGALLVGGIGWLSTRGVTRVPPLTVLRNVG